jgi:hypothetical protein
MRTDSLCVLSEMTSLITSTFQSGAASWLQLPARSRSRAGRRLVGTSCSASVFARAIAVVALALMVPVVVDACTSSGAGMPAQLVLTDRILQDMLRFESTAGDTGSIRSLRRTLSRPSSPSSPPEQTRAFGDDLLLLWEYSAPMPTCDPTATDGEGLCVSLSLQIDSPRDFVLTGNAKHRVTNTISVKTLQTNVDQTTACKARQYMDQKWCGTCCCSCSFSGGCSCGCMQDQGLKTCNTVCQYNGYNACDCSGLLASNCHTDCGSQKVKCYDPPQYNPQGGSCPNSAVRDTVNISFAVRIRLVVDPSGRLSFSHSYDQTPVASYSEQKTFASACPER